MMALKSCVAPKTRRKGRAGGKGAAQPAEDGVVRGSARAPTTSSAAISAQGPESACVPRGGGAVVTARLPQYIERPTTIHADRASPVERRNRSGSWETDGPQASPKFSGTGREEPRNSHSDTRRRRHGAEANDRTLSKCTEAVATTPSYTPAVSRLEWSSSISSDSPRVLAGCENTAPLPVGWFQAERDGVQYYYNRRTGKRLWHHPSGCECPADTPLPLKTLSTASSAQQSPATWTRSGSSDGGSTPHANAYYHRRGWHGAAPTLSLSTNSSGNRTTSAGTGISARTASYATSQSRPEQSPNAKPGASKTFSAASSAAPFPPPPTPVGRGLLTENICKQPGRPGAPRRSIVKMLAQLDRELLEGASSPHGLPPYPTAQAAAAAAAHQHEQKKKQCRAPAPTVSPAAGTGVAVEEGVPPAGAAMAPRGRLRQPRSRRGSFAESVLSQPASIPDEPSSARAFSDHEGGNRDDLGDLGRGWALHQNKRLSTKYETDFEGSGVDIEQASRFEAVSNQHDV